MLLDAVTRLAAIVIVEQRGEMVEVFGRMCHEEHREVRKQLCSKAMSGPGAGDHPVDGTSLQRMIDTV